MRMTRNTILRSFLVPTVLMDASNANSPFVGKKGSAEKRRREKIEKEKEVAREERHAKILASLDESKSCLARIGAVNEQATKRNSSVFTLGTTMFALRGSNDPDAVAVVNDCVALLVKKHVPQLTRMLRLLATMLFPQQQARPPASRLRCQLKLIVSKRVLQARKLAVTTSLKCQLRVTLLVCNAHQVTSRPPRDAKY